MVEGVPPHIYRPPPDKWRLVNMLGHPFNQGVISVVITLLWGVAIANSIFNSKVIFLISMWGGTEDYLLNSLQIVINKAMRVVGNVGKSVKVEELQRRTKWLSEAGRCLSQSHVSQEDTSHKTASVSLPEAVWGSTVWEQQAPQLRNETWRHHSRSTPTQRLALISASWLYRVVEHYRSLPRDLVELRVGLNGDQVYKNLMRKWVIFKTFSEGW